MRRYFALIAAFVAVLVAGGARADALALGEFTLDIGPVGSGYSYTLAQVQAASGSVVVNGDGSTSYLNGSFTTASWDFDWIILTVKPDPFVSLVGGFTNISGSAQDFFFTVTMGATPLAPSTLIGGSTTVSYSDANFNGLGGLTNATSGGAGYSGQIDGVNALDLLNPFSLTPAFAGQTVGTSQTAGLPGPTLPGPAVAATIGITHRFNLSSFDNATFNSTFRVELVPEPATGALLLVGLVGLAALRRTH